MKCSCQHHAEPNLLLELRSYSISLAVSSATEHGNGDSIDRQGARGRILLKSRSGTGAQGFNAGNLALAPPFCGHPLAVQRLALGVSLSNSVHVGQVDAQPNDSVHRDKKSRSWRGLTVSYAWRRPYSGLAPVRQWNRFEIVFSAHRNLQLEVEGRPVDVDIRPGGVVSFAQQAVSLTRLREFCDWLEIYLDDEIIRASAEWHPGKYPIPPPTFDGKRRVEVPPNIQLLSIAHIFRRACLGASTLSDIEADTLAHLLVTAGAAGEAGGARRALDKPRLNRIFDFVEARLQDQILLSDLADIAAITPFHFSRLFKAATGLAPYQYVLMRRLERAKNMLLSTDLSVREIGWELGIENVSHFRRKFVEQFGIRPSQLRSRTRRRPASRQWADANACA
jgi:AraC-like DNA-binding protein